MTRAAALASTLRETLAGTVPDDALDAVVDTLRINVYRWLNESSRASIRAPLPASVVSSLVTVRDAALSIGPGTGQSQVYSYYLFSLHRAGWTLEALGAAVGVTREAVRVRVKRARQVDLGDLPILHPPLPDVPEPAPAPPPRPALTGDETQELSRLQAEATRCRGTHADGHPYRVASERLAELLNVHHERGIRYADLATALGVTKGAVRSRLQHHGYRQLPPSQPGYRRPRKGVA